MIPPNPRLATPLQGITTRAIGKGFFNSLLIGSLVLLIGIWYSRAQLGQRFLAQHTAVNDYHGFRRILQRITLKGDTPG